MNISPSHVAQRQDGAELFNDQPDGCSPPRFLQRYGNRQSEKIQHTCVCVFVYPCAYRWKFRSQAQAIPCGMDCSIPCRAKSAKGMLGSMRSLCGWILHISRSAVFIIIYYSLVEEIRFSWCIFAALYGSCMHANAPSPSCRLYRKRNHMLPGVACVCMFPRLRAYGFAFLRFSLLYGSYLLPLICATVAQSAHTQTPNSCASPRKHTLCVGEA